MGRVHVDPGTGTPPRRDSAAGFTLVEVIIALTILVLVIINVTMVSKTGTEAARSGAFRMALDEELNVTLDRIALALMSSKADDLDPVPVAPGHTDRLDYRTSLGVEENGQEIVGAPERIAWFAAPQRPGQVIWSENPGAPEERRAVWSNSVPALSMDEIANGLDDNDNGLPDEGGLSFDVNGEQINIHLTVERPDPNGVMTPTMLEVNVTCRN